MEECTKVIEMKERGECLIEIKHMENPYERKGKVPDTNERKGRVFNVNERGKND